MRTPGENPVQTLDREGKSILLTLRPPDGYMFLPDQHHFLNISSLDETIITVPHFDLPDLTFDWQVPVNVHGEGEVTLHLEGQVFFCPRTERTVCIHATLDEDHVVRVVAGSGGEAHIVHDLTVMEELLGARMVKPVESTTADHQC
jgi:hypothetical protein